MSLPVNLPLPLSQQPTYNTCGPTTLHALYSYYDDPVDRDKVIQAFPQLESVEHGLWGVELGMHALQRGYRAHILTSDMRFFDPKWNYADREHLGASLEAQGRFKFGSGKRKRDRELYRINTAYQQFLDLGGQLSFKGPLKSLILGYLNKGVPLLAALSATYLYQDARELPDGTENGISGGSCGHFVLIHGYDPVTDSYLIADSWGLKQPDGSYKTKYTMSVEIVGAAILAGQITNDNLIMAIGRSDVDISLPDQL